MGKGLSSIRLGKTKYPVVQVSLDVETIEKALAVAEKAVAAGVDWLEAGTPLILSEGFRSVSALRKRFPDRVIVSDQKSMDGGGLETEQAARAGADVVVVMAAAHDATIKEAVKYARKYGVAVMADLLAVKDKVERAKEVEAFGVDYVIVHTGFDERHYDAGASPLSDLPAVVRAVKIPVQAVGGLTVEQAVETLEMGAKLIVLGAPLVTRDDKFDVGDERFDLTLRQVVRKVKGVRQAG
ncbi:MAG: orotidine 5'-phosphate decarboxylase [Candidatus Brockarchaeota archaeon]|nr:orotidine 5'-phosphate decarboxylase [Candidatus Brockarchaeota archaeon]